MFVKDLKTMSNLGTVEQYLLSITPVQRQVVLAHIDRMIELADENEELAIEYENTVEIPDVAESQRWLLGV